jgi:uncharacterized membrane protein YgdD (TMEM256/DUF423 family)
MKKIGLIVCIIGALGVLFGAYGAHGVKDKIDPVRYAAYRVGIEYLFFHLAPLLFIANQPYRKQLERIAYVFILGIICFTSSNLLMTTEAIHGINFHFMWPITPIGGILFVIGWIMLAYNFVKNKD